MIKYKHVLNKKGRSMFYKNGKMVKETEIPVGILNNLDAGSEITMPSADEERVLPIAATEDHEGEIAPVQADRMGGTQTFDRPPTVESQSRKPEERKCVFCGTDTTRTKFINSLTIPVCTKDKETHTTGEILERARNNEESSND